MKYQNVHTKTKIKMIERWNGQNYGDEDFGGGSGDERGTVMWWWQ